MRRLVLGLILLASCDGGSNGGGAGGGGSGGSGGSGGAAGGSGGAVGGSGGSGGATGGSGGATGGSGGGAGGVAPVTCGDGDVDLSNGEECDDGNLAGGDGCSAACTIEAAASCGDGTLDLAVGEECDDGNNAAGDGCSPTCQFELVGASCGDSLPQGLEVCDDGNQVNGDGCNPTCNFKNQTTLFAGMPPPAMGGYLDGAALSAQFNGAGVLAVDDSYLYVAEELNRRLRRIDIATGLVTTLAGTGAAGAQDSPVGTAASFGSLEGIGTDGITLWVGDSANHVIRAVSLTAPYAVTTVAGTAGAPGTQDGVGAAAGLDGVRGITYYGGLVYFVDPAQGTLRSLDPVTQKVTTLAGAAGQTAILDGLGQSARLHSPRYMASDNSGVLYFAENLQNMIRSYNTVTTEVKGFLGAAMQCGHVDGVGSAARINRPRGLTSDGTSLYWVEFNAHTIRQAVAATGQASTMIGTPSACSLNCSCGGLNPGGYAEGVGAAAILDLPFSIAFHWPTNSLFFHDSNNHVIRRIQ